MIINPRVITTPNGRQYVCFWTAAYAYKWARTRPEFQHRMAVRIGHLTAFAM
jgi:hypothetical protein